MPSKPVLYDGRILENVVVTWKIDGVRMLRDYKGDPVSRRGKPLYNLEKIPAHICDAEVYLGSWEESVSAVRKREGTMVDLAMVYSLEPLDPRLLVDTYEVFTEEDAKELLKLALAKGFEGLVVYSKGKSYKIKPEENYDVLVTGATKGKGKYEGLIGALITPLGNVSGFNDEQRRAFSQKLPELIEVKCMGLTPKGKFRHPRFVRERFDKELV